MSDKTPVARILRTVSKGILCFKGKQAARKVRMVSSTVLLLATFLFPAVWSCPNPDTIAPSCICRNMGNGPMMICSNIMSAEELIPPIRVSAPYKMFSLALFDSSLLYLPGDLFHGTTYQKVMFSDTKLMALSDSDLAFEGLEDLLEEIRATGTYYITQWDWSQLRNQRRIELIEVHKISMYSVDQEFPPLNSLKSLGIIKADISHIHPTAFVRLKNLNLLVLKDNEIKEMSRKMLPDPANELEKIDLSGNKLRSLPADMFTNMPNLKELDLSGNAFDTLTEATFKWVFQNLQWINMLGNDIHCDCRMRWFPDVKKPIYFDGECNAPPSLKGKSLKHVVPADMRCLI